MACSITRLSSGRPRRQIRPTSPLLPLSLLSHPMLCQQATQASAVCFECRAMRSCVSCAEVRVSAVLCHVQRMVEGGICHLFRRL